MTSAHSTTTGPLGAVRLGIFASKSHEMLTDGFILYYNSSHIHEVEQTTTHAATTDQLSLLFQVVLYSHFK